VNSTLFIAGSPTSVIVLHGQGQTVADGSRLPVPLTVFVEDSNGYAVPGVTVSYSPSGLTLSSAAAVTNESGVASVTAAAAAVGTLSATATVSGVAGPAIFYEHATAAPE
jgi:hypothetical protein